MQRARISPGPGISSFRLDALAPFNALSSPRVWQASDPFGIGRWRDLIPALTNWQVTLAFPPVRRFRVAQSGLL